MRVAMIGLPYSGKSTLFKAVAEAGGTQVHMERADQEHLVTVKVPDDRLHYLEANYKAKKRTHAEIAFLDVPGLDLTDEAARQRARAHWVEVRQSEMLVLVLRNFHSDAVPPYRDRIDYAKDVDELHSEMLFADLEQVAGRIEKLQAQVKKPSPDREALQKELELMVRLQDTLENEKPLSSAAASQADEKLLRSFAFLTAKPAVLVINCDEGQIPADAPATVAGYPAIFLSAKLEEDLAALGAEERAEFMKELGVSETARDRLVKSCYKTLNLISFLTAGEKEARAWTIPAGTNAQLAAAEIHTDISRGFIRAEVFTYDDLVAAKGDEKAVKAAGKFRLEGKTYIVKDGDVIVFRFNV